MRRMGQAETLAHYSVAATKGARVFWRLTFWFSLAILTVLAVCALAVGQCVDNPDVRWRLTIWLILAAAAGILSVALLSAGVTRRMAPALRDLTAAADRIAA